MGFLRRALKRSFYLIIVVFLLLVLANIWIISSTNSKIIAHTSDVPEGKVALVLGTSHLLVDGSPNPFFHNRIKKAASLLREGRVSHIIVSGDNRTKYYNEPLVMRKALMELGVPYEAITLDYAGLRTLDSIVRSKEIFGQEKIIIVTQEFHGHRAIFISNFYGIDAVVSVADDPEKSNINMVYLREYFARAKAILDLYILKTEPRYLGEKEPLDI
ncbi:MAG: ElyC/SanA/YdcF family protein [Cyclobacteriaceae bacterium]